MAATQRPWKVYVHGSSPWKPKSLWYCIDLESSLPEEGDEKKLYPVALIESETDGDWALIGDHIYWTGGVFIKRDLQAPEKIISLELKRHNIITSPDPSAWETVSTKKLPLCNPCMVPLDDGKRICFLGGRKCQVSPQHEEVFDERHYGEVYNLETNTWHFVALNLNTFIGNITGETCALMENGKVVVCIDYIDGRLGFYDVSEDSFRTEIHPHFVTLGGESDILLTHVVANVRPVVSNSKLYWFTNDLFLYAYDFVQQKWFKSQYVKELESWKLPWFPLVSFPILVDLYNGEEFLVLVPACYGKFGMAFLDIFIDVSKGVLSVNVKSRHTFSPDDPQFEPRGAMAIMAMQAAAPPSLQVVGKTFVEQYYHLQHHSPELVNRFYQDSSVLSHPDSNGLMSSVTTMKNINDKLCSLDYKNYKAEIKTADVQESQKDGVIILVTGCLTRKDNLRRKFTQTFFLAPQDKSYFVLNDVFRYVEENETDTISEMINGTEDVQSKVLTPNPEPTHVADPPNLDQAGSYAEEVQLVEEKSNDSLEDGRQVGDGREIVVEIESHFNEDQNPANTESANSVAQEDTPKKSYASLVSSQTKKGPTKIYVPINTSRTAPPKAVKQPVAAVAQTPAPVASNPTGPSGTNVPETNHTANEAEGHPIYVCNLPLDVTVAQLEAEFKRYGPTNQGGVQVRSNRQQGFCFGFVEFEDESSMHGAIQASPITIGGRQAVVEMKRTTTRVGSARGRFHPGRGRFRNDNFRGRGNFGGGRSYGRNEFGGCDFSGRGRGQGG